MSGTQDELLGKARLVLMSLDMEKVYQGIERHGEVVEFYYNSYRCVVIYKDGYKRTFRRC